MAVVPWLSNYPFSDPYFQEFQVQQYLPLGTAGPSQTYAVTAPEAEAEKPAPRKRAAKAEEKEAE